MFTRPEDLTEGQIRAELAASWQFAAETLSYLPVGFGCHHWRATDAAGRQLFLIVHDLPQMLHSRLDTPQAAFGRLETALGCALSLRRDANLDFVIPPIPTTSGQVVRRLSDRYSLAACAYLENLEPCPAGEFPAVDRPAVVRLLTDLHQARPAVPPEPCEFTLQNVDGLKTPAGFVIVDWDFVRLAPPERDLWDLAETDPSVLTAYVEATGTAIDTDALAPVPDVVRPVRDRRLPRPVPRLPRRHRGRSRVLAKPAVLPAPSRPLAPAPDSRRRRLRARRLGRPEAAVLHQAC
jgi:hypothetical protein